MKGITVSSTAPKVFNPVTITITSAVALANLLGALVAYGKGKTLAEGELKAIGLGEFYSGNVRAAARELAAEVAAASGVASEPDFSDYLGSAAFKASHPSKAGAAVVGTEDDLAPGREATHFEDGDDSDDIG